MPTAMITGDRYLSHLLTFIQHNELQLLDSTLTLKLTPLNLLYIHSRLDSLQEIENLLTVAPVDYLRCYVSDLGDHRALERLRRVLRLLAGLKVVGGVEGGSRRDPARVSLMPFASLRVLELRGCDLSTTEAKGLLELRGTLERLICHNSTDALSHVFASRIVEIKDSANWNKLSFVSCACNNLVIMDESLQLLPSVETLDLSRNRFSKVDNLKKCVKLKHLDLGFNQLRSITMLSEVSSRITKLNLRNNGLSSLKGLENMKSLEQLDLSSNIISSFRELERVFCNLTQLEMIFLEGNPVSCARWYRPHIFSFFTQPDKLRLDGKKITTKEHWERHVIFAKRQKKPTGYGFYFPAKEEEKEDESHANTLNNQNNNNIRRRSLRVASIQEENQHLLSDSESTDHETLIIEPKDENTPESETKVTDLINKAENLKKENSVFWLKEFKVYLDQDENNVRNHKHKEKVKEKEINSSKLIGESSLISEKSVNSDSSINDNNINNGLNVEINGHFENSNFSFNNINLPPQYKEDILQKTLFSDDILEFSDDSSETCGSSSDENLLYLTSSDDDEVAVQNGQLKRIISLSEDLNVISEFDRGFCENWEEENKDRVLGFFENFFEPEICECLVFCECILKNELRNVAIVQSSENKFYVLLIEKTILNSQEIQPEIIASYKFDDLKKVIIGLGLQSFRLEMADEKTYIFLTTTIEKSHELFSLLKISTIPPLNPNLSLQSWEQEQVKLLEKEIHCDLKSGILFYTPLLFSKDKSHGGSRENKCIFLIDNSVIICIEDLSQFGMMTSSVHEMTSSVEVMTSSDEEMTSAVNEITSSVEEMPSSSKNLSYYSVDSCCLIKDILQVVVDLRQNKCMALITENNQLLKEKNNQEINEFVQIQKWRFQFFSQDILLKFISLLKASHLEITDSPLRVNYIS